jgi:hypothetical protein
MSDQEEYKTWDERWAVFQGGSYSLCHIVTEVGAKLVFSVYDSNVRQEARDAAYKIVERHNNTLRLDAENARLREALTSIIEERENEQRILFGTGEPPEFAGVVYVSDPIEQAKAALPTVPQEEAQA